MACLPCAQQPLGRLHRVQDTASFHAWNPSCTGSGKWGMISTICLLTSVSTSGMPLKGGGAYNVLPGSSTKLFLTGKPSSGLEGQVCSSSSDIPPLPRRQAMVSALLMLALPTTSLPASAETHEDAFELFQDATDKYSFLVPPGWTKGQGKDGARKVTAFFPAEDPSTNVNIVITPLGADYRQLGSFGTAYDFAVNLVNSLDRSWTKPPGQAAKLIDSRSANGMYFVEYSFQKPGERKRHLLSAVGIGFNGWYNRLYTLTGQFWEDDADKFKPQVDKVISSFKLS